jgi:hypothetical protein
LALDASGVSLMLMNAASLIPQRSQRLKFTDSFAMSDSVPVQWHDKS